MEARESKISETCLTRSQLVRLVTYTERGLTDGRGGIVKMTFLWGSGLSCSYTPIWLINTITKLMESYYVLTDGYKLFKIAIITFNARLHIHWLYEQCIAMYLFQTRLHSSQPE